MAEQETSVSSLYSFVTVEVVARVVRGWHLVSLESILRRSNGEEAQVASSRYEARLHSHLFWGSEPRSWICLEAVVGEDVSGGHLRRC
jgi:hypothetical protein